METKKLYKISKYVYREAFLESQVQMAGSNISKIMEQMEKNKNYMRTQSTVMKVFVSIFLAAVIVIPIQVFLKLNEVLATNPSSLSDDWILLSGTASLSIFTLIQIVYLLVFGMFFASGLVSGDVFHWLVTLPFTKKDLQKISFLTFFRGMNAQFIVLTLVLPIATGIMTHNIWSILVSIVYSLISVAFAFGLLTILGEKMDFIMKNNDVNSRKATLLRILPMVGYLIMTMVISIGLQYAIGMIDSLFAADLLSETTTHWINIILALIPIPSNSGIAMMFTLSGSLASWDLILAEIVGFVILLWITKKLLVYAIAKLNSQIFVEKTNFTLEEKQIVEISDVEVHASTPVQAFFDKDKQMATRDIQLMMMLIMPIFLPVISSLSMGWSLQGTENLPLEELVLPILVLNTLYSIMGAIMLSFGLMTAESTGASVMAALPVVVRDQAVAKIRFFFIILPISSVISILFFIGNPFFEQAVMLTILNAPAGPILAILFLEIKARLFGRMKSVHRTKYVLEDYDIEHKIPKWILIFVLAIGYFTIFSGLNGYFVVMNDLITLTWVLLGIEGILGTIAYFTFNKMFPKYVLKHF